MRQPCPLTESHTVTIPSSKSTRQTVLIPALFSLTLYITHVDLHLSLNSYLLSARFDMCANMFFTLNTFSILQKKNIPANPLHDPLAATK